MVSTPYLWFVRVVRFLRVVGVVRVARVFRFVRVVGVVRAVRVVGVVKFARVVRVVMVVRVVKALRIVRIVTPFLDIPVTRNQNNTLINDIHLPKENFHRSLHKMGFLHSSKVQDKLDILFFAEKNLSVVSTAAINTLRHENSMCSKTTLFSSP